MWLYFFFFFSSRRRHTRCLSDWSSDVCSSDLRRPLSRRYLDYQEDVAPPLPDPSGCSCDFLGPGAVTNSKSPWALIRASSASSSLEYEIGRASCRERV